jgi:hypothetical protein
MYAERRSGLMNFRYICLKWFPRQAEFAALPIFLFLLLEECFCTVKNICIFIYYITDCVEAVYELPFLRNSTVSLTYLHKSGFVRSVEWVYTIGVQVTGRTCAVGQSFLQSSFQTGSSNITHLLPKFLPCRIPLGRLC